MKNEQSNHEWLVDGNTVYELQDTFYVDSYVKVNRWFATIQGNGVSDSEKGEIARLFAASGKMRDALIHITEYWNGDRNDQAMYDALWEIINTAESVLAELEE